VSQVKSNQVFKALQQAGIDLAAGAIEPLPAPGRDARDARAPALPSPNAEFMKLYLMIDALRTPDRPYVLQFVAASAGEGTSTIAAQFARTAALDRGRPVLLVDCHGGGANAALPALVETCRDSRPLLELPQSLKVSGCRHVQLSNARYPLLELDAAALQHTMSRARAEFPVTVLDCAAIGTDPQSAALARLCDGTLLVVRAEVAARREVHEARDAIVRHGGQLLGVVFNRWRSYIPEALSRHLT
jgi:Mrp family chromosome partitioning ATPase